MQSSRCAATMSYTEQICRLCLSKLESEHESLDEVKRKGLRSILLELNLAVTSDNLICKRCARNLEHSSAFKKTCLQTEEIISAFVALGDRDTMDLKEMYLSENADGDFQLGDDYVCRFCLLHVKKDGCMYLNVLKENVIVVRNVLPKCLPELDFSLTFDPVICTSCIKSMERFFTFSTICSEVEQKIQGYICSLNSSLLNTIKLEDVVSFIEKDLMGNSNGENCVQEDNLDRGVIVNDKIENDTEPMHVKNVADSVNTATLMVDSKNKPKEWENTNNLEPPSEKRISKLVHKATSKSKSRNTSKFKHKLNITQYAKNNSTESLLPRASSHKYKNKAHKNISKRTEMKSPIFKCEYANCNYENITKKLFLKHAKTHCITDEEHKCNLCPFTAKRKNHLAVHILSHDPRKIYKCDCCNYETRRKNLLLTHVKTHREPEKDLLKCVLCPYEGRVNSAFKRHMQGHTKSSSKPNNVAQDLIIIKEGGNLRLVKKENG